MSGTTAGAATIAGSCRLLAIGKPASGNGSGAIAAGVGRSGVGIRAGNGSGDGAVTHAGNGARAAARFASGGVTVALIAG